MLDRKPATLPFADLRRIELAKAIARDPAVVLVDEPFAGLTARETGAFAELIAEMRRDGRAVLIVDHNVKSIASLADRVFAMYVGERIAEGPPRGGDERRDGAPRLSRRRADHRLPAGEAHSRTRRRPFLEVEGVDVFYDRAQALEKVSLHVHQGEFVAVVGLNGAGKTTLFNAISGLLPYRGAIRREGRSLAGVSAAAIAAGGVVQAPEGRDLFTDMTVAENLDMGALRLKAGERTERLDWLFDLFPRLKERLRQTAGTLSGGEQQMLTIARALMTKPDLIILDEPTLGLAPIVMEQISKALERLRQTTDITVLLGEQNVTFALPHADRVYVLEHARIVWEGPPSRFAEEAGGRYI